MRYLYVKNISGMNHVAIPDVDNMSDIIDSYSEYEIIPEVRMWFLDNLNSTDWFFDKFTSMFYFRYEEDFVAFKLRWT